MSQRISLDVGLVLDPAAWEGKRGVMTVAHVRGAMRGWARRSELDVDELVSLVWMISQRREIREAAEPRGLFLYVLEQEVYTELVGQSRLAGGRSIQRSLPGAAELKSQIGEIESAIRESYARKDQDAIVLHHQRLSVARQSLNSLGQVIRSNAVVEHLVEAEAITLEDVFGASEGVQACVDLLSTAGLGVKRAEQLVKTIVGQAFREGNAPGIALAADRLRRNRRTPARLGMSTQRWSALIRLIVGSRKGTPGVVARIELGESAEQVCADPAIQSLVATICLGSSSSIGHKNVA